jgi:beta-lactamase superfamily II metal-dependent hydrolase
MVILEALNAFYGDCLVLRYPGPDGKERLWIVDGGPKAETVGGKKIATWKDVLLPRLKEINPATPLPVALGMVSHIDDDHIFGVQKLTNQLRAVLPAKGAVEFSRFWFNSFDKIVGPKPAGLSAETEAETASLQSLASTQNLPGVDDEHAQAIMESIAQGNLLAGDLRTLNLQGNNPVNDLIVAKPGQAALNIEGAKVTVLGPLQTRLDKLRDSWAKALQKPDKGARQQALEDLFLPKKSQDKSVPNLSSIVVLVEVGGKRLLLTGDAHGDDIVEAWSEIGLGALPATVDVLKMPHHGSIRNCTEKFLRAFVAKHYVFSANGKFDNPDAPTLEALVEIHGNRDIVLHFTNEDVTWEETQKVQKTGAKVKNLNEMLQALRAAFPGPWKANIRKAADKSVVVQLA